MTTAAVDVLNVASTQSIDIGWDGTQSLDHEKGAADTIRLWLVAAALYFVTAAATIHLTSDGRGIATIWPANAILLALLLTDARPRWSTILSAGVVGNIAANVVTRETIAGPILYSLANVTEVALAVSLVGPARARKGLLQSNDMAMRFIGAAGLLAPLASGVLGAATAFLVFGEPIGRSFLVWVLSDGLELISLRCSWRCSAASSPPASGARRGRCGWRPSRCSRSPRWSLTQSSSPPRGRFCSRCSRRSCSSLSGSADWEPRRR